MATQSRATLVAAYLRHRQGLYTLALSITRCQFMAEDVVQDAFAHLWMRSPVYVGDAAGYLFAAVRNAAIDQVRRRRDSNMAVSPDEIYESPVEDPLEEASEAELRRTAARIVSQLPDEERDIVVMKVHAGLTFAQIAEALGKPTSTVAYSYHNTLAKMRSRLEGRHG